MKTRRFSRFAIATLAVAALALTGLAVAHNRFGGGLLLGKRLEHALVRAGVDETRAQSIVAQAKTHRDELIAIWKERIEAVQAIAALSPDQGAVVQAKVQDLLASTEKDRATLHGILEEIGSQLSAPEKAKLVLNFADRIPRFGGECGSRIEGFVDRLEDNELVSQADAATIQTELEKAAPDLCNARDTLRGDVEKLRAAVGKPGGSDKEIEALLGQLKTDHEVVAKLRAETVQSLVGQLSPASQIAIAERLVRLHSAARVMMGI
jgi:hypothetical protein